MNMNPRSTDSDADHLGELAMKFRGSRGESERRAIAETYARAVERLIDSGHWHEMPALEDQLPHDCMPAAFFAYWARQPAVPKN